MRSLTPKKITPNPVASNEVAGAQPPKNSLIITSYNIHKGMSPLNRFVKMEGIAAALNQVQSDIICLQEVQGQNLKRVVKYNEFPDQSQHE
ncbi:hypothetical protein M3670_23680, partial [Cytobacillus kochii]|uniref:endonuclease/exonuclease/phosphatase family protein n=1 Tax=Cytobacillus kochii TaxID=859143 RepID=UPI0020415A75